MLFTWLAIFYSHINSIPSTVVHRISCDLYLRILYKVSWYPLNIPWLEFGGLMHDVLRGPSGSNFCYKDASTTLSLSVYPEWKAAFCVKFCGVYQFREIMSSRVAEINHKTWCTTVVLSAETKCSLHSHYSRKYCHRSNFVLSLDIIQQNLKVAAAVAWIY